MEVHAANDSDVAVTAAWPRATSRIGAGTLRVPRADVVFWLDPSLVVLLGVGEALSTPIGSERTDDMHFAVELSAGLRFENIALCAHARASTNNGWDWDTLGGPKGTLVTTWDHTARTLDAGLGLEIRYPPVFVFPWTGGHFARGTTTKHESDMDSTDPAPPTTTTKPYRPGAAWIWGLQLGLDIATVGPYHLALFTDFEATSGSDRQAEHYAAWTFGIAAHR